MNHLLYYFNYFFSWQWELFFLNSWFLSFSPPPNLYVHFSSWQKLQTDSVEQWQVCVTTIGIQMNFRAEIHLLVYLCWVYMVSGKKRSKPFFSRERIMFSKEMGFSHCQSSKWFLFWNSEKRKTKSAFVFWNSITWVTQVITALLKKQCERKILALLVSTKKRHLRELNCMMTFIRHLNHFAFHL